MPVEPVATPSVHTAPAPVPGTPLERLFGLGLQKKAVFFRELATMTDAGLSASRAVRLAAEHAVPRRAEEMARELQSGQTLSRTLSRYPYFFGEYEVSLVAAGEAGGSLDARLGDVATSLEATYEMLQQVLSRLWYPLIVLHCALFIPTLPMLVLKGPLAYLALTLGVLVPCYLLVFLLYAAYRTTSQSSGARGAIDRVLGLVPFLGKTLRTLAAARFLDCLGHLYEAGMPPSRSLQLAARSCGNTVMAGRLAKAAERVDQGERLTEALATTGALPTMAIQMLATGEESGRLPDLLAKAATYMHREVEQVSQQVMTLLPVLVMLVVGAVVGFLVIRFYVAQLAPLYQM